tara:strand:+ start:294 stop:1088 length:795 start_codon:yes stop_codon:yes gene_type:complete
VKGICLSGLIFLAACVQEVEKVPAVPVVEGRVEFDHDHPGLAKVLKEVVHLGLVDYGKLLRHRDPLNAYLVRAALVSRENFDQWTRAERMAFLLNVYNATTMLLLADHHPVKSIKDISTLPPVWKLKVVRLFGKKLSLDDVEHGMIRKQFESPQIHFALVCGARSCPPLREEPYTPKRLEAQFADQARSFLADKGKNYVDMEAKVVHLSPIFKWYARDFGKDDDALLKFISPHLNKEQSRAVEAGGFKVSYTDYDWSLNEAFQK